ncbi:hypothetical protein WJX77_000121 [Trebouxia sp. C0004]
MFTPTLPAKFAQKQDSLARASDYCYYPPFDQPPAELPAGLPDQGEVRPRLAPKHTNSRYNEFDCRYCWQGGGKLRHKTQPTSDAMATGTEEL